MLKFLINLFKKEEKPKKSGAIIVAPPKPAIPAEPKPRTTSSLDCHEDMCGSGHINFGKTKAITRSFKRKKLRESLEERRDKFYSDSGDLYNE